MSTGGASYLLSIERGGMGDMVVSPEFAGRMAWREGGDHPPLQEQKAGREKEKRKMKMVIDWLRILSPSPSCIAESRA